jgi:uncharacterized protein (UPF0335 family)
MAEKLNSNIEPQKAIDVIKNWMQLDFKKMSDSDALQLFYLNTDFLIEHMEAQGFDVQEIKKTLKAQVELLHEIIDIKYPEISRGADGKESALTPLEKFSLKSDALLLEAKIERIMLEFKELTKKVLDIFNEENEEFQGIKSVRDSLNGALVKIPDSKNQSPNN